MSLSDDLVRFTRKVEAKANTVARKTGLELLRGVVLRSPVDTGRFRGNWQVGVNHPDLNTRDPVDKAGGATLSRGIAEISDLQAGDRLYITNNLPYAKPLEEGSSQQAPNGMVGVTVAEFQRILARATR